MRAQTDLAESYLAISEGHERIQTESYESSDQHNARAAKSYDDNYDVDRSQ